MDIIALHNLKRGVGKTATAVDLADQAARAGVPTLLCDLDAQAAASGCVGRTAALSRAPGKLFRRKSPIGREIVSTAFDYERGRYGKGTLRPFLSMVDRRRLHRTWTDHPTTSPARCLETWIPYATDIEQMSVRRQPIAAFAPRSTAADVYRRLWPEIAGDLGTRS